MSFLKSVLLGSEGSYKILGVDVEFTSKDPHSAAERSHIDGVGLVSQMALACINSNIFRLLSQGYMHVLIHEFGHAMAARLLLGDKNMEVTVFTKTCTGMTFNPQVNEDRPSRALRMWLDAPSWKKTAIAAAGPMNNVAFSVCKLAAAKALKDRISWPVSLLLGSGAVIWIAGELLYAHASASRKSGGDFGGIAKNGKSHLALASSMLVTQSVLGILLALNINKFRSS